MRQFDRFRSRREMLRGSLAASAGGAALWLAGCGDDDDDNGGSSGGGSTPSAGTTPGGSSSPAAAQPRRGGVTTSNPPGAAPFTDVFDPHQSQAVAMYVWNFIGNTAVRPSPDATKVEPELAASWELPGDGTEIVMKIREGVKWHNKPPVNGRAWTAQDLAYNLNRISGKLDSANAAKYARRATLAYFDSATAVDNTTVRVKLARPTGSFINGLADYRNLMVPSDWLEGGKTFQNAAEQVGTGPFIIESLRSLEAASFKRNPDYWDTGKPYIDEHKFVWITDPNGVVSSFSQGQISWITEPTGPQFELLRRTNAKFTEEKWPFTQRHFFRFNISKDQFKDARVRRALQLVLPYKEINDAVYPNGWDYSAILPSPFSEAIQSADVQKLPGWNPATKDADIKTAKDLMTAAGYPDGALTFGVPGPGATISDLIVRTLDAWKKVWPRMDTRAEAPPDLTTYLQRLTSGNFDMYFGIEYSIGDAALDMESAYGEKGPRNYSRFSDPAVEDLIQKSLTEINAQNRKQMLLDAQNKLIEHMPVVFSATPYSVVVMDPKLQGMKGYGRRVGGGASHHDQMVFLRNGWLEA